MLLYTQDDRQTYYNLERHYKETTGVGHESASSLADYQDCKEKGKYRRMFRSTGVAATLGSVFHEYLNELTKHVLNKCITENKPYEEILEELLQTDTRKIYDKVVFKYIEYIPIDIITGKLLCKEKDRKILRDIRTLLKIFNKCYEAFTPEVIKKVLDEPPLASEIGGYLEYEDACLLYGYIDKISIVSEDTVRVMDYKFKFSNKSQLLTPRFMFQVWVYEQMVLSHNLPNVKNVLKTLRYLKMKLPSDIRQLWLSPEEILKEKNEKEQINARDQDRKPRTYRKLPDPVDLSIEVIDKNLNFTEIDHERFKTKLESLILLKKHNLGFIGESQYGCNFCDYKGECLHAQSIFTLENDGETDE